MLAFTCTVRINRPRATVHGILLDQSATAVVLDTREGQRSIPMHRVHSITTRSVA